MYSDHNVSETGQIDEFFGFESFDPTDLQCGQKITHFTPRHSAIYFICALRLTCMDTSTAFKPKK